MAKLVSSLTEAKRYRPKVAAEGAPIIECDLSGNLKITLITEERTHVMTFNKGDTRALKKFLDEDYVRFNFK